MAESESTPDGIGRYDSSFPDMVPPAGGVAPGLPTPGTVGDDEIPPAPLAFGSPDQAAPPVVPTAAESGSVLTVGGPGSAPTGGQAGFGSTVAGPLGAPTPPVAPTMGGPHSASPPTKRSGLSKERRILIVVLAVLAIAIRLSVFMHNQNLNVGGSVDDPGPYPTYFGSPWAPDQTPSSHGLWTMSAPGELGSYVGGAYEAPAERELQILTAGGIQSPAVGAYDVSDDPQSHLLFYGVALLNGTIVPDEKISAIFADIRRSGSTVGPLQELTTLPNGYGQATCAPATTGTVREQICVWAANTAYAQFTFTGPQPADTVTAGKTLAGIIRDVAQPY